jgi:hypothetical protein
MSGGRLWLAIVIGPLAWLMFLEAAYALVPWACRRPTAGMIALVGASVVALALASVGLVSAWQTWRHVRGDVPTTAVIARTRFMALTALGTSALFVLIVVAGMLPLLLLPPCS